MTGPRTDLELYRELCGGHSWLKLEEPSRLFPSPCSIFQILLLVEEGNLSFSVHAKGAWNTSRAPRQDAKYRSPSHNLRMENKSTKRTRRGMGRGKGGNLGIKGAATRKLRTGKQGEKYLLPGAAPEPVI